jgi:glutaredoxin-like protein
MATAQQALIPAQEKSRLKRDFRKHLKSDVTLRFYTQRPSPIAIPGRDCRYCSQVQQLLEELSNLSPRLKLETVDFHTESAKAGEEGVNRIPATVLDPESGGRLRFFGLPLGYGLPVLIDSIKSVSRGATRLSVNTRKQLRRVNRPVHLQVFVTPASEVSAGMALLAHAMAVESANITADVIEAEEFPDLARRYGLRQVPLTIINEFATVNGMVGESELLERVLQTGVSASEAS